MPVDPHASRIGLHMAAMSGNIKVVRALLGKRSPATNVEERDLLGDSGLLKAARYGHLAVIFRPVSITPLPPALNECSVEASRASVIFILPYVLKVRTFRRTRRYTSIR